MSNKTDKHNQCSDRLLYNIDLFVLSVAAIKKFVFYINSNLFIFYITFYAINFKLIKIIDF